MKLYATITSERASKGQGGNERLDIQISLDGGETQGGVIAVREIEGVYTIVYFYNGEAHKVNQIESKGERQKGERANHHSCAGCRAGIPH